MYFTKIRQWGYCLRPWLMASRTVWQNRGVGFGLAHKLAESQWTAIEITPSFAIDSLVHPHESFVYRTYLSVPVNYRRYRLFYTVHLLTCRRARAETVDGVRASISSHYRHIIGRSRMPVRNQPAKRYTPNSWWTADSRSIAVTPETYKPIFQL